jgi:hypothetical protein
VSNPVAPSPAPEGSYPPPANQGFGAAPTPGDPQQGFGDAPAQPEPKKKSRVGKVLLRIGLALIVGIAIFFGKSLFFSATDKAKDANVGDCIAASKKVSGTETTNASAKVVDCSSADAAYVVAGKVPGETDVKSKSCDKFFKEGDQFFVYAADNGATGYLLCLRAKS